VRDRSGGPADLDLFVIGGGCASPIWASVGFAKVDWPDPERGCGPWRATAPH
jgi:hypothetical protein